jgi:hypothetical protein
MLRATAPVRAKIAHETCSIKPTHHSRLLHLGWRTRETGEIQKLVTKSWPVTAPGSQGVFRGRGRGFGFLKNGRQAAIVLSWLLLVQLPGQVLRSYSSKVSKSKRFLIVKQILVYSVTAKLSTEQYLVVRYWFTRMR